MRNCFICQNWHEIDNTGTGKCRANPPLATLVPVESLSGKSLTVVSYWPETKSGDCCGHCVPSELLMAAARQGVDLKESGLDSDKNG